MTENNRKLYVVRNEMNYVCAMPGWEWTAQGLRREHKSFQSPGLEWTKRACNALVMCLHTAVRACNLSMPGARIIDASIYGKGGA